MLLSHGRHLLCLLWELAPGLELLSSRTSNMDIVVRWLSLLETNIVSSILELTTYDSADELDMQSNHCKPPSQATGKGKRMHKCYEKTTVSCKDVMNIVEDTYVAFSWKTLCLIWELARGLELLSSRTSKMATTMTCINRSF